MFCLAVHFVSISKTNPTAQAKNLSSHSMQYLQLQTKFCLPYLAQKQANCQLGLLFPTRFCQDFSRHIQDSKQVATKLALYFTNIKDQRMEVQQYVHTVFIQTETFWPIREQKIDIYMELTLQCIVKPALITSCDYVCLTAD